MLSFSASTARRTPFVAVVVALLAIGLVGQLLLNTSLQRGSFVLHDMQIESGELDERVQVLEEELARLESPSSLAARARLLGMVPSGAPVFLQLATGSVQGTPTAAPTPTPPVPTTAAGTNPGAASAPAAGAAATPALSPAPTVTSAPAPTVPADSAPSTPATTAPGA